MADQPVPPPTYDAQKDAKGDAAAIKTVFDNEGAEKAYGRLQQELDPKTLAASGATTADQQRQYQETMTAQLKESGVLPELSIAHAMANKKDLIVGGRVDGDKVYDAQVNAKNPVDRALVTELGDKYNKLKDSGSSLYESSLKTQLDTNTQAAKERAAGLQKQTDDRKNLGGLFSNPKAFDAMAGNDGQITENDAKAFREKFRQPGTAGDQFRESVGGPTREGQDSVRKLNEDVLKAFKDGRNDDNKKGAVIHDATWPSSNYMDRASLAKGMGYKDAAEATAKLPTDTAAKPPVTGKEKDDRLVPPVVVDTKPATALDLSNTALKRGEGPWHVAGQMMGGEKFNDPGKARDDLKNAIRTVFNDKEKAQQITPENLGKVRESVNKSGNDELKTWFENKYPKTAEKAAVAVAPPAEVRVEPAKDYGATKLGKEEGSYHVARRMTEGQNLSDNATKALQKVIAGGFTDKQGAEQITAANLEDVRKKVEAAQVPELTTWFNKRYPAKPSDRR
ncbi:MAG: hypothetical protein IAF58_16085 [Leptolyngbya sp.]|nr:hypothetical protein [Candidatus Melainabacteria bacterium]